MLTEGEGGRRSWLGGGLTTTGDDDGDLGEQWLPAMSSEAYSTSGTPPASAPSAETATDLRGNDSSRRTGLRTNRDSPATT